MKTATYESWGEKYDLAFGVMRKNPLALCLYNKDKEFDFWEPFCDISINSLPATEDTCYVKNYSENEGLDKWLVDNGFAAFTGRQQASGFVTIPEMKFNLEKIKEYELKEDAA